MMNLRAILAACAAAFLPAIYSGSAVAELSGLPDLDGDLIADIGVREIGSNQIEILSAQDGSVLADPGAQSQIDFFNDNWELVDHETVFDGNGDGVADDLAIVAAARSNATGQIKAQLRYVSTGNAVRTSIGFLNSSWNPKLVAVLEDVNGDGSTADAAIGVLATNKTTGRNMVELRQISDGSLIGKWGFFTPDWEVKAVGSFVTGPGNAYIAVLATDTTTNKSKVQMRRVADASKSNVFFAGSDIETFDMAVLADLDGNGTSDDAGLVVLGKKNGGNNIIRVRRADNGAKVKDSLVLGAAWESESLVLLEDFSGNSSPEFAAFATQDNSGLVKIRDYATGTSLDDWPLNIDLAPSLAEVITGATVIFEDIFFDVPLQSNVVDLVAITFRDDGTFEDVHNDTDFNFLPEYMSYEAGIDSGTWELDNADRLCMTYTDGTECFDVEVGGFNADAGTYDIEWYEVGGSYDGTSITAPRFDATDMLGTYAATFPDFDDLCNVELCTLTLSLGGGATWVDGDDLDTEYGTWVINEDGNLVITWNGTGGDPGGTEMIYIEDLLVDGSGQYQELAIIAYADYFDEPEVMSVVDFVRIP